MSPDGAAGGQCELAKASVGGRLSGPWALLKAEPRRAAVVTPGWTPVCKDSLRRDLGLGIGFGELDIEENINNVCFWGTGQPSDWSRGRELGRGGGVGWVADDPESLAEGVRREYQGVPLGSCAGEGPVGSNGSQGSTESLADWRTWAAIARVQVTVARQGKRALHHGQAALQPPITANVPRQVSDSITAAQPGDLRFPDKAA